MKKTFLLFAIFILMGTLYSYSQKANTVITGKTYDPIDFKEEIVVFGLTDAIPENSEEIGTVEIGGSEEAKDCDYETVVTESQLEARKLGGNAIKITNHEPPDSKSSCHRISATILRIDNVEDVELSEAESVTPSNSDESENYALLHFYRPSGAGALVGYDIYLDDAVICRAINNWKETVKITVTGHHTIWAKTESKSEVPIVIENGKEYYIRCRMRMGVMVGRPDLELMSITLGKVEHESVKGRKK